MTYLVVPCAGSAGICALVTRVDVDQNTKAIPSQVCRTCTIAAATVARECNILASTIAWRRGIGPPPWYTAGRGREGSHGES